MIGSYPSTNKNPICIRPVFQLFIIFVFLLLLDMGICDILSFNLEKHWRCQAPTGNKNENRTRTQTHIHTRTWHKVLQWSEWFHWSIPYTRPIADVKKKRGKKQKTKICNKNIFHFSSYDQLFPLSFLHNFMLWSLTLVFYFIFFFCCWRIRLISFFSFFRCAIAFCVTRNNSIHLYLS